MRYFAVRRLQYVTKINYMYCVSYLQVTHKFTKVSTECVTDSRKRTIKNSSGLVQILVTVTHKIAANSTKCIAFLPYAYRTV